LAEKALLLAPQFRQNWNYGNAIHLGHTVLGLLALRQGDIDLAIDELRKSGDTPGSPQLNSFGPTMQLAKELVQLGQTASALEYLEQCRRFWKSGATWLDLWEAKIRSGQVPNCFQHCYA
jgi:tetratricopeptide (TPR) repeat protein